LEDEQDSDTAEAVIREVEDARLRDSIERLPDRERRVLVRCYGLDEREPATLADLSAQLSVSRGRVRQLQLSAEPYKTEGRALTRFRNASRRQGQKMGKRSRLSFRSSLYLRVYRH